MYTNAFLGVIHTILANMVQYRITPLISPQDALQKLQFYQKTMMFSMWCANPQNAEELHSQIEGVSFLIPTRQRIRGRSSLIYESKTIPEEEMGCRTDRKRFQQELKLYIRRSLPYLRAECADANGTPSLRHPFCIESICQILGIHRNMLYKPVSKEVCLIDSAGVRPRKFRRIGSRHGFKAICELPRFACGCDIPCWSGLDDRTLQRLWNGFKDIAGQLSPQEKEHRYLMSTLFCPLTNSCVRVFNTATAQLYSYTLQASV